VILILINVNSFTSIGYIFIFEKLIVFDKKIQNTIKNKILNKYSISLI
jgi:hypothetical protein